MSKSFEYLCSIRTEILPIRKIFFLPFVFGLITYVSPSSAVAAPKYGQIIDGTYSPQGKLPHIVSIVFESSFMGYEYIGCGGTLIAPQWVLTAAHCVIDEFMIRLGGDKALRVAINRADLGSRYGEDIIISRVVVHPDYNFVTGDADIALIKLVRPAKSRVVQLATEEEWNRAWRIKNVPLQIAGWGLSHLKSSDSQSSVLRESIVQLSTKEQCEVAYPGKITPSMFCAGLTRRGEVLCQGDSGSGIFYQFEQQVKQVGVLGWSRGCESKTLPGIYTQSALYLKWIGGITGRAL